MPAQLATLPSPAWSSAVCCDYYVICTRHHHPTYGYITLVEFLNQARARPSWIRGEFRYLILKSASSSRCSDACWDDIFDYYGAKEDDPENGWNFLVCEEPARGAQQKKKNRSYYNTRLDGTRHAVCNLCYRISF